jgi:hypothetical protein
MEMHPVRRNLGRGDSGESSGGDGQAEWEVKGRARNSVSMGIGRVAPLS